MWKRLENKIDLEGPTPIMNQVYLGCSQRPAEVDEQIIASKAEFFKRITTSRVKDDSVPEVKPEPTTDKNGKQINVIHTPGATTWKVMLHSA